METNDPILLKQKIHELKYWYILPMAITIVLMIFWSAQERRHYTCEVKTEFDGDRFEVCSKTTRIPSAEEQAYINELDRSR